jgi:hypothetical protein
MDENEKYGSYEEWKADVAPDLRGREHYEQWKDSCKKSDEYWKQAKEMCQRCRQGEYWNFESAILMTDEFTSPMVLCGDCWAIVAQQILSGRVNALLKIQSYDRREEHRRKLDKNLEEVN